MVVSAAAGFTMGMVVMVMFMFVFVFVIMSATAVFVMVMVMTTVAVFTMFVMMFRFGMILFMGMLYFGQQFIGHGGGPLHFLQQISAVQLIPRRCHNNRMIIVLSQQIHCFLDLIGTGGARCRLSRMVSASST